MEALIGHLLRARIDSMLLLFGFGCIYFAVFSGVPSLAEGQVDLSRRDEIQYWLLSAGAVVVASAVALFLYRASRETDGQAQWVDAVFGWAIPDTRVAATVLALSKTQRVILKYLYRKAPMMELSLDELFNIIEAREPGLIASSDELYYRLKDLSRKDLLDLKSIQEDQTQVLRRADAGRAISKRGLLMTN